MAPVQHERMNVSWLVFVAAVCVGILGQGCSSSNDAPVPDAGGCEQQSNGGLSLAQCTCAAMVAMLAPDSGATVIQVDSTTSDQINGNYDLGLPSGTPVCFVSMAGLACNASQAPGASVTTLPYTFAIYMESPWRDVEDGCTPTLPTPSSE